jgi:hypothetical protein
MHSLSFHAESRTAQRCITDEQIEFVREWGTPIPQRGRVAFHLGARELQRALQAGVVAPRRVGGVIVIEARDGTVVTVIRSEDRQRLKTARAKPRSRRRMH